MKFDVNSSWLLHLLRSPSSPSVLRSPLGSRPANVEDHHFGLPYRAQHGHYHSFPATPFGILKSCFWYRVRAESSSSDIEIHGNAFWAYRPRHSNAFTFCVTFLGPESGTQKSATPKSHPTSWDDACGWLGCLQYNFRSRVSHTQECVSLEVL